MSTRSLTVFYDDQGKEICVMYRHCDGYPSGHGEELKQFLSGKAIVNGICDDARKIFNGMKACAAQTVAHFTSANETGGYYLHAAGTRGIGEEYIYKITGQSGHREVTMECMNTYGDEPLFKGPVSQFDSSRAEQYEQE